jgi:N-acetylmuramoyl-L-alanine amidase
VRDITHIVVHHSASPLTTTAADIDRWHRESPEINGPLGYHLVVEWNGDSVRGRPIHVVGAHCRGHNATSLGICLVGNNTVNGDEWTRAQIKSLGLWHYHLSVLFPDAIWLGHRDMPGAATLCPGLDVRDLLGLAPLESVTITA